MSPTSWERINNMGRPKVKRWMYRASLATLQKILNDRQRVAIHRRTGWSSVLWPPASIDLHTIFHTNRCSRFHGRQNHHTLSYIAATKTGVCQADTTKWRSERCQLLIGIRFQGGEATSTSLYHTAPRNTSIDMKDMAAATWRHEDQMSVRDKPYLRDALECDGFRLNVCMAGIRHMPDETVGYLQDAFPGNILQSNPSLEDLATIILYTQAYGLPDMHAGLIKHLDVVDLLA